MSKFSLEQSKKKWADYEDSDSEREDNGHNNDHRHSEDVLSEEEYEDSGSDKDELDLSKLPTKSTEPAKSTKKPQKKNLSKKELQELKKKELEDLNSLLAEFSEGPSLADNHKVEEETEKKEERADKLDNSNEESRSKKKKNKKKVASENAEEAPKQIVEKEGPPVALSSEPVDISAVLKARTAKNTAKKPAAAVDPVKIALEEAKNSNKKKKKDKSKFNETSY